MRKTAISQKFIYKCNARPKKILQTKHFLCVNWPILCDWVAEAGRRTCPQTATALTGLWMVPRSNGALVYIDGKEIHLAMSVMPSSLLPADQSLRRLLNVSDEQGVWLSQTSSHEIATQVHNFITIMFNIKSLCAIILPHVSQICLCIKIKTGRRKTSKRSCPLTR